MTKISDERLWDIRNFPGKAHDLDIALIAEELIELRNAVRSFPALRSPQPAGVRVDEHSARITAARAAFESLHGYSAPDDMSSPYGPKSKIGQAFAIADAILSALETQEEEAVAPEGWMARASQFDRYEFMRGQAKPSFIEGFAVYEAYPLFAHPTPVQKEEEGQTVSEEMVERAVRVLRRTMHMTPEERARAVLVAALVKP